MSKLDPEKPQATSIRFFPAFLGPRAVFMVEARTKKEIRQIEELFGLVGKIARVVPISRGAVMSFAVQVDADSGLFSKVEWLLKTQFSFSMVERNFSNVTFKLVHGLCVDAEAEVEALAECGICGAMDPFPTRATVTLSPGGSTELAYCARCAQRYSEPEPELAIRALIRLDQRRLRVPSRTPITVIPEMVEGADVDDMVEEELLARIG